MKHTGTKRELLWRHKMADWDSLSLFLSTYNGTSFYILCICLNPFVPKVKRGQHTISVRHLLSQRLNADRFWGSLLFLLVLLRAVWLFPFYSYLPIPFGFFHAASPLPTTSEKPVYANRKRTRNQICMRLGKKEKERGEWNMRTEQSERKNENEISSRLTAVGGRVRPPRYKIAAGIA